MPRLVILNAGPDTAGCGIGLKRAFDRYAPDWETRAICRQKTYLGYEPDLFWPRENPNHIKRQVIELVQKADVIHVMDLEGGLRWFKPWLGRQTIVVHHLGTHFRRNPEEVSANCRAYGAVEVTDSIDLMLNPQIRFLPVTTDTHALAELRKATYKRSKRIRIAHAPTHRAVKSTDQIIEAIRHLSRSYPIDFDLIEGVSNAECLERKARSDIFVDQLMYGFGVNNIECWSMGIPVVSGWEDAEHRERSLRMFGQLPWADATERTLEAVIEHLITDAKWRRELGERGRVHAEAWHSQRSVVNQTLDVYEKAGLRLAA